MHYKAIYWEVLCTWSLFNLFSRALGFIVKYLCPCVKWPTIEGIHTQQRITQQLNLPLTKIHKLQLIIPHYGHIPFHPHPHHQTKDEIQTHHLQNLHAPTKAMGNIDSYNEPFFFNQGMAHKHFLGYINCLVASTKCLISHTIPPPILYL